MVERRVEDGTLVLRSALDAHAAQLLLPSLPGLAASLVEGEVGCLCLVVLLCALHVDKRDAYLHLHGLASLGGELREETYVAPLHAVAAQTDESLPDELLILRAADALAMAVQAVGDRCAQETVGRQHPAQRGIEIDGITRLSGSVAPAASFRQTPHPASYRVGIHHLDVLL